MHHRVAMRSRSFSYFLGLLSCAGCSSAGPLPSWTPEGDVDASAGTTPGGGDAVGSGGMPHGSGGTSGGAPAAMGGGAGPAGAGASMVSDEPPGIQYVGRWDRSDPNQAVASWGPVGIRARFEGTS